MSDSIPEIPDNANPLIVSALDALTCNQDYEVEVVAALVHIVKIHTVDDGIITLAVTLVGREP